MGTPCGVHQACISLNCEGGFCVDSEERSGYSIWSRELQTNATAAPAAGNASVAPTANGTSWDGTVTLMPDGMGMGMQPCNASHMPGGIFNHQNCTMGTLTGSANASVAPRPTEPGDAAIANATVTRNPGATAEASGSVSPGATAEADGSVAPRPTSPGATAEASGSVSPGATADADGSVAPRPTPMNGTEANVTTMAPTPAGTTPAPTLPSDCTKNEDCGDKYFCSSLGICEELNCLNWANHTPPGSDSYSEMPCVGEGAQSGTAFCGWDGNCYAYNCQDWYKFGPVAYTGYDPNNPVELTCEEYKDGYDENMNSVTFGCRTWQPGNKAPEAKSWTHFFNLECLANPRNDDDFKCYQNIANTDYRDFQAEVARLNPPSCDREIYDNEQNLYWYVIQAWQDRKGEVTKYKHGRENTLSGESFNANLAEKTMFALLVSNDDAPEQTFPDAIGGPTRSGSTSRILGNLVALSLALVGLVLL